MRDRFDALRLPVVMGHGDLKPSNIMYAKSALEVSDRCGKRGGKARSSGLEVSFIDFELTGFHYRGYDLCKLFRTSGEMSTANLNAFLQARP